MTKIDLTIYNDIKEISRAIDFFTQFSKDHKIDVKIVKKFIISIDELLNNIIHYGYPKVRENAINLILVYTDTLLSLTIIDQGIPFNPLEKEKPQTNQSIEDRPIGGLGIHLVKNMMDEIEYTRENNKNVLTLSMHL
jgi:anti-sigma regulatory factor (Ser/Thr protein kinase)